MKGSRFLIVLVVMLAVAVGYYFATTNRDGGLVLVGTVDANQVIVSAKIQGRIEKLLVDEGTPVKQGDVIAVLDSAELEAQKRAAADTIAGLRSQVTGTRATELMTRGSTSSDVVNARARLQSVQSQLTMSEANLEQVSADTDRTVSLADQGVASRQDRDRAVAALKSAKANVQSLRDQVRAAEADLASAEARLHNTRAAESNVASTRAQMMNAEAQLAQADTRLGYTRVVAPIAGVVSLRAARQGEVVNPGVPIVTLVDLSDTWVRAAVPETYADKIALGDTLNIRMPSGAVIPGKVIFKNTEGDFATQRDVSRSKRDIKTVAFKLRIDNQGMKYATGMTAEVLVPASKLNAASPPAPATGQGK
ncbi:MAG TPA: efflux RND transporter periplasmic adaptor subunit [Terriglobales bacterium]|jgi:multidrug resistance efflux pump|nr:efflux RND transporter periplasmic adaptor subunit [Terriglobales bacterium]